MNRSQWNYFLVLERDLVRTLDYVELAEANMAAYSNELAKLLLLVGSEVDVVAKMLCKQTPEPGELGGILDYQSCLTAAFVGIDKSEVSISRYGLVFTPWEQWQTANTSPDWWRAYNKVKHSRDVHFVLANLGNVVEAICGLLILLKYHYRLERTPEPYPALLECGFPEHVVIGGGHVLPGLEKGKDGKAVAPWDK